MGWHFGNNTVRLVGIELNPLVPFLCRFGDKVSRTGFVKSYTEAFCVVPPGTPGVAVEIYVSMNGGFDWVRTSLKYSYFRDAGMYSVAPSRVNVNGYSAILIGTSGLQALSNLSLYCIFGSFASTPAAIINHGTLRCATPSISSGMDSEVRLQLGRDGDISDSFASLEFVDSVAQNVTLFGNESFRLEPSVGPCAGGFNVSVQGIPATASNAIGYCAFSSSSRGMFARSDLTDGKCLVPAHHPAEVSVFISLELEDGLHHARQVLHLLAHEVHEGDEARGQLLVVHVPP